MSRRREWGTMAAVGRRRPPWLGCFFLPSFRLTNRVSGASQPQNHPKTNHQSHQISLYCDSTWYNVHTYIRAEFLSSQKQKTAFRPYSFFANVKEPRSDKEIEPAVSSHSRIAWIPTYSKLMCLPEGFSTIPIVPFPPLVG